MKYQNSSATSVDRLPHESSYHSSIVQQRHIDINMYQLSCSVNTSALLALLNPSPILLLSISQDPSSQRPVADGFRCRNHEISRIPWCPRSCSSNLYLIDILLMLLFSPMKAILSQRILSQSMDRLVLTVGDFNYGRQQINYIDINSFTIITKRKFLLLILFEIFEIQAFGSETKFLGTVGYHSSLICSDCLIQKGLLTIFLANR